VPDADEGHEIGEGDFELRGVPFGVGEEEVVADAVGDGPVEVDLVLGVGSIAGSAGESAGVDFGDGEGVEAGDGVTAEGFELEGSWWGRERGRVGEGERGRRGICDCRFAICDLGGVRIVLVHLGNLN